MISLSSLFFIAPMIRKKYIPGGSLPECVDSYLFRQGIKLMTGQIKNKQRGVAAKTKNENIFGKRLKLARTELGIGQNEMSSKLGVAKVTYANWEGGKHQPDIPMINKIAHVANKPVGYFFGESVNFYHNEIDDIKKEIMQIREELSKCRK